MPENDGLPEEEPYKDSADELEDFQREILEHSREQMRELRADRARKAKREKTMDAYTGPPSIAYPIAAPSVTVRKIDNGWIVHYWAGIEHEVFCEVGKVGALVEQAARDIAMFHEAGNSVP